MVKLKQIYQEIKIVGKFIHGFLDRRGKKTHPISVKILENIKFDYPNYEGWWVEYPKGYLNIAIKDIEPGSIDKDWWIDPEVGLEECSNKSPIEIKKIAKKYNLKIKEYEDEIS